MTSFICTIAEQLYKYTQYINRLRIGQLTVKQVRKTGS
jgi:hypothetical protein